MNNQAPDQPSNRGVVGAEDVGGSGYPKCQGVAEPLEPAGTGNRPAGKEKLTSHIFRHEEEVILVFPN